MRLLAIARMCVLASVLGGICSGSGFAATINWVGGGSNGWSDATQWSPATVPGAGDTAQFSANADCNINQNVSVAGINIQNGYANTITQNGFTITVGSAGWTQAGGTFAGSSTLKSITINGPFSLSDGSLFTSTTDTLTLGGNVTISNTPTFLANGGSTVFLAPYNGSQSISPGSLNFNNVTIDASYSSIQTISGTLNVNGSLTLTASAGSNRLNGGTIAVSGDVSMNSANFANYAYGPGSATISLVGVFQTISGNTLGVFPHIAVNSTGTVALSGTIVAGGNWTWSAGSIAADSSTLLFLAPYLGTQTIAGDGVHYNNVTLKSNATSIHSISNTLFVDGNLTLDSTSYGGGKLNGGTVQVAGNVTMASTGFGTGNSSGTGTIKLAGAGAQTLAGNAPGVFPNIVVENPTGTVTLSGTINAGGNWTWNSGAIATVANTQLVFQSPYASTQTIAGDSVHYGNVTIKANGPSTQTISGNLFVDGNLTLDSTVYGGSVLNGGVVVAAANVTMASANFCSYGYGPGTATIRIGGNGGTQTIFGNAAGIFPNIVVDNAAGMIALSGTIYAGSDFTWNNGLSGPDSSTLVFLAVYNSSRTITGGSAHYNNVTIKANGPSIQTVVGDLFVDGNLALDSTSYGGSRLNGGNAVVLGNVSMNSANVCTYGYGPGTLTVKLAGSGSQTIFGNAAGIFPNVLIDATGTVGLAGTIYAGGNWTFNNGSLAADSSNLIFAATYTSSPVVTQTITGGPGIYNNVTFSGNAVSIQSVVGTLNVGGNLVLTEGHYSGCKVNGGTLNALGNLVINSANFAGGTAAITLSGSAAQNVTVSAGVVPTGAFTVAKNAGSIVTLQTALTLSSGQSLTVNSGSLDLNGQALTLNSTNGALVVNDTLRLQGTENIQANTTTLKSTAPYSTVVYYGGAGTAVMSKLTNLTKTFGNLTFGANRTHQFTADLTNDIVVNGVLASTGDSANPSILRSTTAGQQWRLKLNGTSSLADKVDVKDSNASHGNLVVALNSIDSGNNVNWLFFQLQITWPTPADITYGTSLSATQLNATANAAGAFVYAPPAGTVLNAGNNQTLSVTFTPNNPNIAPGNASVFINVLKATPTVTWNNPADINQGTALSGTQLNATANVAGTFDYSPAAGTVLGVGDNQTLLVTFMPNDAANYNAVVRNVSINVLPVASMTIQVAPSLVSVNPSATKQFNATAFNQDNNPIVPQPEFAWNVSGGGTIDANGLFTAQATPVAGPFTVTASFGNVSGTATITRINAPPVITNLSPANGNSIRSPRPVISAAYSADGGVDVASIQLQIDNLIVPAVISPTAVVFTTTDDLFDGVHTIALHVASLPGLSTDTSWQFLVDSAPPTVNSFNPDDGDFLTASPATITAAIADSVIGSGINYQAPIHAFLDGNDVTNQSVVTVNQIAVPVALANGEHVLTLSVSDMAGNIGVGTTTFTIVTQAPPAPIVDFVQENADQIVVAGHVPVGFNISGISATVTGSSTGLIADVSAQASIVGEVFQVVFIPSHNASSMSANLAFTNKAGVQGPAAPLSKSFADNAAEGDSTNLPPFAPKVKLRIEPQSLTGDKTGTNNGENVSFTKNNSVLVYVSASVPYGTISAITVYGGTNAVESFIIGGSSSVSELPTILSFPAEGQFELSAVATALNAGETSEGTSETVALVVDSTPPEIDLTSPKSITTAPLGFLYLNGKSEAQCQEIRNDAKLPRNVFSADHFELGGAITDVLSDISAESTVEIRETASLTGDVTYPYSDYATQYSGIMSSILAQTPVQNPTTLSTTAIQGQAHAFTFNQVAPTASLSDSIRGGQSISNVYLFTLKAIDKCGNETRSNLWVKVNRFEPIGAVGGWVGNHGTTSVGPITGFFEGQGTHAPIVRVFDSDQVALNRGKTDGAWLLAAPISAIAPTSGTITVEDFSGNTGTQTYLVQSNSNLPIGVYDEYTQTEQASSFGGETVKAAESAICILGLGDDFNPNPTGNEELPGRLHYAGTVSGGGGISLPGGDLVGIAKHGGTMPYTDHIDLVALSLGTGNAIGLTPTWEPNPRTTSFTPFGEFPQIPGSLFPDDLVIDQPAFIPPNQAFQGDEFYLSDGRQFSFGAPDVSGASNNKATLSGTATIAYVSPSAHFGLNDVGWDYSTTDYYRKISTYGGQFASTIFTYEKDQSILVTDETFKPRALNVLGVLPDAIGLGQRTKLRIYGYFGDVPVGRTIGVSFSNGIKVIPSHPGEPLSSSGFGKIVPYNTANHTVAQAVEVEVLPDEVGVSSVTVGGIGLQNMIDVVAMAPILDANHDGDWTHADYQAQQTLYPVIMSPGFGLDNHPALGSRVKVRFDMSVGEPAVNAPTDSIVRKRGELKIGSSAKLYKEPTGGEPLTTDQLTWTRTASGADGYYDDEGNLDLPPDYIVRNYHLFQQTPEGEIPVPIADGLSWVCKAANPPLAAPPEFLYLEFARDEVQQVGIGYLNLTFGNSFGGAAAVVELSNGLGADSLSPATPLIPGFGAVGLTRGNVFLNFNAATYNTPLMGPDVSLSYNHLDGLGNWRTNYDLTLFENSVDANADGIVTSAERKQGDLLVFIDETGRRHLFNYDTGEVKFLSDSKTGLTGATVQATEFDTTGDEAKPLLMDNEGKPHYYRLQRNDNRLYYFGKNGRLERIENLRHEALIVQPGSSVRDKNGRVESLRLDSFGPPGAGGLSGLSGRMFPDVQFTYYANNDPHPGFLKTISIGGYSHSGQGSNTDIYTINYNDRSKANSFGLASVAAPNNTGAYSASIVYTDSELSRGSTQAVITDYLTGTTNYSISPDRDVWTSMQDDDNITTHQNVNSEHRWMDTLVRGRFTLTLQHKAETGSETSRSDGATTVTTTYTTLGDTEGANLPDQVTLSNSGGFTKYDYFTDDAKMGLVKSIKDPSGFKTSYTYDAKTFLKEIKDRRNQIFTNDKFNKYGQPVASHSPLQRKMSRLFDSQGRLKRVTDSMRYSTQFKHDSMGRQSGTVQPSGKTEIARDPCGRTVHALDLGGRSFDTRFDGIGRPALVQRSGIGDTNISYDPPDLGAVRATITRAGRTLVREYRSLTGRLLSQVEPRVLSGSSATDVFTDYFYTSGEGWLAAVVDARNHATNYDRDSAGRVTLTHLRCGGTLETHFKAGCGRIDYRVDADDNRTLFDQDPNGRPKLVVNALGGMFRTTYDGEGNVDYTGAESISRQDHYVADNDGLPAHATDQFLAGHSSKVDDQLRRVTHSDDARSPDLDSLGNGQVSAMTRTELGSNGLPRRVMGFVGDTLATDTRGDGVVRAWTEPLPGNTTAAYTRIPDLLDRITSETTPVSSASASYNSQNGDLESDVSVLALTTTYARADDTGELLSQTDSAGANPTMTVIQRDENGNVKQYRDARNRLWTQEFDNQDRRISQIAPDQIETIWAYTKNGKGANIESVSVAGLKTRFEYNGLNQRTTTTDPTDVVTTQHFDELGRMDFSIVAGVRTDYAYDPSTGAKTDTTTANKNTHFSYDKFGRLDYMVDPENNYSYFHFDNLNRLTQKDYPDGKFEKYEYTTRGQGNYLDKYTDRANRVTRFEYDGAGRVYKKKLYDNANHLIDTITLGYNAAGQVESEMSSDGTVTHGHDTRGRLSSVTHAGSVPTVYTYNNDNSIATKAYSGQSLVYNYETNTGPNLGRLMSVQGSDGSVGMTYDFAGRVHTLSLPGNVTRTIDYDDANRVVNIEQALGSNFESYEQIFDYSTGRLQTINGPNYSTGLTYDTSGRLKTETRQGVGAYNYTFGYDARDNRTSQTGVSPNGPVNNIFVYNTINQLRFINPGGSQTEFTYDDAGNRTNETRSDGTFVTNNFDRLNRLTSVTSIGGGNPASQSTYEYYGPTWMRASATTSVGLSSQTTQFKHDGYAMIGSSINGVDTTYMVPGSEHLWETSPNGTFTYAKDGQGSVTALWDATAAAYHSKFTYDQYGAVSTTDAAGNPIANTSGPRYRGEFYNAATDKTYLRNREYDASTGTFMSMDSVPNQNLYGYCGGDPVNRIDPMGLYWHFKVTRRKKDDNYPFITYEWLGGGTPPSTTPSQQLQSDAISYFKEHATATEWDEPRGNDGLLMRGGYVTSNAEIRAGVGVIAHDFKAGEERAWKTVEYGATIGTIGGYGAIGLGRGVLAAGKEFIKDEIEGWVFGKVIEGGGAAVRYVLSKVDNIPPTGVPYWDEKISGNDQFKGWQKNLESRGWKVVPDATLEARAEIDFVVENGVQTKVMRFNPETFSRLEIGHESIHIIQVDDALKAGYTIEQITSKRRIPMAETVAYQYEKRLSEEFGFSSEYVEFIEQQLKTNVVDWKKLVKSPAERKLWDIFKLRRR